jgi:uroporphyrin-III C-methyltransferase
MTTDVADRGTVYLVGAGPGDPDLLTVRARRLIDRADVLLYDSLTPPEIVASAPGSTETIDVGKKPGPDGERTTQAEINRLMVDRACGGDTVVRLKGGDPNVFGRGGEETQHLADREIPFEVVPGVSSVLATGVTGIPLTHREHASSLTVVTGHEDPEKAESALDWSAIADTVSAGGTLVVLMGVRRLPDYAAALRARGVDPETPVAMVQKATWDGERTATGTLETIVDARDEAGIEPPAITVVGDVVSVREEVAAWLQRADASGLAFESEAVPIPGVANGAPGGD